MPTYKRWVLLETEIEREVVAGRNGEKEREMDTHTYIHTHTHTHTGRERKAERAPGCVLDGRGRESLPGREGGGSR